MAAYSNAHQAVPALFVAIMQNDAARSALLANGSAITVEQWAELKRLNAEHREFMRAAEEALRWNTNKGATG